MPLRIRCEELDRSLDQQEAAPVYLVMGEEDYLRDWALARLKSKVLGEQGETGFNCDVFYSDEAAMDEVLTCASEAPAFAPRRLVILKGVDKVSARDGEALLRYMDGPMPTTTLVCLAAKLDGRLKLTQALTKLTVVVDCSPLRDGAMMSWIRRDADQLGVKLKPETVQMLKEIGGDSLYAVRRELEKLACYLSGERAATPDDVETLRGTEPGASVFDMLTAIVAQDRARLLRILARNLEVGEAPLRVLGALVWQFRRLWKVKDLLDSGGREGEAARLLRVDPSRMRSLMAPFSTAYLTEAFRLFMDTDAKLKGGSSGAPSRILELLLLTLCRLVQTAQTDARAPLTVPTGSRAPSRRLSNVRTVRSMKSPRR